MLLYYFFSACTFVQFYNKLIKYFSSNKKKLYNLHFVNQKHPFQVCITCPSIYLPYVSPILYRVKAHRSATSSICMDKGLPAP